MIDRLCEKSFVVGSRPNIQNDCLRCCIKTDLSGFPAYRQSVVPNWRRHCSIVKASIVTVVTPRDFCLGGDFEAAFVRPKAFGLQKAHASSNTSGDPQPVSIDGVIRSTQG